MNIDHFVGLFLGIVIGGLLAHAVADEDATVPFIDTNPTNQFVINIPEGSTFSTPLIETGKTTVLRDSTFEDIEPGDGGAVIAIGSTPEDDR